MTLSTVKHQRTNSWLSYPAPPPPPPPRLNPCWWPPAVTQAPTWLYFQILPLLRSVPLGPIMFIYFSNPRFCFRSSPSLEASPVSGFEPSAQLPEWSIQNANVAVLLPCLKTLWWLPFTPGVKFHICGMLPRSVVVCPIHLSRQAAPYPRYLHLALHVWSRSTELRRVPVYLTLLWLRAFVHASLTHHLHLESNTHPLRLCAGGISSRKPFPSLQRSRCAFSGFFPPSLCHITLLFTLPSTLMAGSSLRAGDVSHSASCARYETADQGYCGHPVYFLEFESECAFN